MAKTRGLQMDSVVIKTAMTPEQLADHIGGSIEWTSSNKATKKHVVFMPRVDFDAAYKRRYEELIYYLDEVTRHAKDGGISKEAENAVAQCLKWCFDQVELMQAEQKKLIEWVMEANDEVAAIPRRAGAAAKLVKNPDAAAKAIAKAAAVALWPNASRKGLNAVQFHAELVRLGHRIAPDTARKWLTALRKTGTC